MNHILVSIASSQTNKQLELNLNSLSKDDITCGAIKTCSASCKLGFRTVIYKMAAEKRKPIEFFKSENDNAPKFCVSISDFSYRTLHTTFV